MKTLGKKYGLFTSIGMVVGVVIGSGIFFKADDVLAMTNGNIILALWAWILGAVAMIFGSLAIAEFAQRVEKSNGIVDYYERAYGPKIGYLVGWFNGTVYYAPLSAILAWISSTYTLNIFKVETPDNSTLTWILALIYLILFYLTNYYSAVFAGKFQVAATAIKLIPLVLIAVIGSIYGIKNGVTVENFAHSVSNLRDSSGSLAPAVVSTAFAYDGWLSAVTINNEIRDAKKNLPRALVIGAVIVLTVYVTYFLGITGVLDGSKIIVLGDNAVNAATRQLFGGVAGVVLSVFVVVSCLGTLNGLVIACIRMPFSLAVRGQGPLPKLLSKVDEKTEMPTYSVIYAFLISTIYLGIWYASLNGLFPRFIAIDEIPIVLLYGFYIFLYIWYIKHFSDLKGFKRYVVPSLAIIGSLTIVYGGITNPSIGIYLLISLAIIVSGLLFYRGGNKYHQKS